jgi:hypothetical protein
MMERGTRLGGLPNLPSQEKLEQLKNQQMLLPRAEKVRWNIPQLVGGGGLNVVIEPLIKVSLKFQPN